jgi:hypothetical protein
MSQNEVYLPIKLGPARKGRPRKHGGYSILYNAEVPYARKKLMRYFREVRAGLIRDLGGEANVTTGQLLLIDRVVFKLGFLRLVEIWLAERGTPFSTEGQLEPVIETYLSYSNSLRNDLNLLGIDKREIPVIDLKSYIAEKYGQKSAGKGPEKPQEPRSQQGQGSSSAGNEAGSQDLADSGQKQGSESLLNEKSPAGQGSDIDQSGAIVSDGQGEEK